MRDRIINEWYLEQAKKAKEFYLRALREKGIAIS